MTKKKKKVSPTNNKYSSVSFKVEETVVVAQPKSVPLNLAEEKARFIKTGLTPRFEVQDQSKIAELAGKTKNQIRFELLGEAEHILENVRDQYGDGELFLEHAFGSRITKEQATPMVLEYINENSLSESLKIHWCDSLACSAKMVWKGPVMNANKPELRKYSLWINYSDENNYMRESGIKCLMDHEIGTHFFRLINDGFQPWFSDRTRFDLRSVGSFEGQCTEEGLASIHTALRGRVRMLWSPALAYYTACKAAEMSFKELFDHLGRYTSNIDFRWKQVMRVKRGLADPGDLGGFGNDQCYFEGAVKILRSMDTIDFHLLMSGKVCMDEVDRIKRVVRKDVLRFPTFMKNMAAYRRTLKKMLVLNGLDQEHFPRSAPAIFTQRLAERSGEAGRGDHSPRKSGLRKVRSKPSKSVHSCKYKAPAGPTTKKSAASLKEKDVKKKVTKVKATSPPEVEKFPVSTNFVNTHQARQGEARRREKEAQTSYLETRVRRDIASLGCGDLGEHIEQLRSIVRGHTWASSDSGYRDSLISEVVADVTVQGTHAADLSADDGGGKANSILTLSVDMTSSSLGLDSARVDDCDFGLEDYDDPEKKYGSKEDWPKRRDFHKEDSGVSESLSELKVTSRPCSGSVLDSVEMKTDSALGSVFDSKDLKTSSADARNRLASKRRIVAFPHAGLPALSSLQPTCQSVSLSLDRSPSKVSERSRPCTANVVKSGESETNVQGDGGQVCEGAEDKSGWEKVSQSVPDFSHGDSCVAVDKAQEYSHVTNLFTGKPEWRHPISQRSSVRILKREQCKAAVSLKAHYSFDEKFSVRTSQGTSDASSITQEKLSTKTTYVKFRVPKLQTNVSKLKSVTQTDKNNSKTKFLVAEKPLLTTNLVGERQLAGLKLGSLAKEKYSCFVNVSTKCAENPVPM